LKKKEGEKKKEKNLNNTNNHGRISFTENENPKVPTKKSLSSKKGLNPIDESISYLKNVNKILILDHK